MKSIAVFVLMFVLSTVLTAQPFGTISGTVTDNETKRPLENANVIIAGTTLGASTSTDGEFTIERIPIGKHTVVISYLGYLTRRIEVEVSENTTTAIDVRLEPTILPGQTILITAMRGKERETPVTFASLKREEIQKRYTYQDIPVLLSELPSITYYSESGNGIGYNYITLRGFDQRRLSVMINGIPQNDPEDHNVYWLDFPDLLASTEDIQVQRGAGSAFYGPPAIGGSVNLVTSVFSNERTISVEAGVGSYNTQRYSVGVGSGLIDNRYVFFGRLSRLKSDGYRDQSWSDFSGYFLGGVRYGETTTTQFNLYGGPFKDHLAYYGIPKADIKDRTKRRANPIVRPEEIENFSQPHYELLHEWRPSERWTVNNTLFLIEGEGFFDYDGSWADTTMLRLTRQYGFSPTENPTGTIIRSFVDNTQWGWLPRATFDYGVGAVTAGLELRLHRSHHYGNIRWGQGLPTGWYGNETADYRFYEYRGGKDIASAYVQNMYRLQPTMNLMTSVQYVFNRYSISKEKFVGKAFDIDYHFVNPRVGLNVNLTENVNTYATVAYTSREPRRKNLYDATFSWAGEVPQFRQNNSGAYDFSEPLVKPEKLLNLEIGGGYSTPDLKATANLYWMDFRDEIVKSGQLDRFGQPITGNAERTLHQGIELTGWANPFEGIELIANMTFSRNRLVKYIVYDSGVPQSLNGNTIAGFPDVLANARVSYSADGLYLTLSMQHVGEFYTDNFQRSGAAHPHRTVDAVTVFHAWAGYRFSLFELMIDARLQINNLFNALYASHGEGDDFFPAAERNMFASLKLNL